MKYKVGDKVIIRKWDDMKKEFGVDACGHIKAKCCFVEHMRKFCGREMTIKFVTAGENYRMEEDSLWAFSEDTFEKKHIQKIVITAHGNETLARLYENGKVVNSATAKCSPEDAFDFSIGAKLAFDRLFNNPAKKKETYYNGKVVCVKSDSKDYTVGKIYEFINGTVVDNDGHLRYGTCPIKDPSEIVSIYGFIPYVE